MSEFSVLMATYRGEKPDRLSQALQSMVEQTLLANEIVLVRDGELTPELEDVINGFTNLPIVDVKYSGGQKLGGALAVGLESCSYEIVARMDSDDIACSDRFERQLASFSAIEADIIGGQVAEFHDLPGDGGTIRKVPLEVGDKEVGRRNPINHMTVVFSRSTALEAGNYIPMEGFEDWYLWLRMYRRGAKIANIDEVVVNARVGDDFVVRRSGWQYAKNELAALSRFREEKLISLTDFLTTVMLRLPIRLLPTSAVTWAYSKFLRNQE